MKKLASALLALLIGFTAVPGLAGDRPEHDSLLEKVLFGTENQEKISKKYKKGEDSPLTLIEYACYLTIDQAGKFDDSNGNKAFNALKKFHVARMPTIEQLSLTNINMGNHRKHTHKGWNYLYKDDKDANRWKYRKRLLLETTKKVFGFQKYLPSAIFGYTAQCDSLAALMYYVHIIDDYKNLNTVDKISKMNREMICFARKKISDDDVFSELEKHLSTLFEDQQENKNYLKMMKEIEKLGKVSRNMARGGYRNSDVEEFGKNVDSLLETLKKYVPELLKNEPFFTKVFEVE